jgi:hypothetical protein
VPCGLILAFATCSTGLSLFITGSAWLVADQLKNTSSGDGWQETAAYQLMIHGGAAMVTLMLLGAMVPMHVRGGWRNRKNRVTGTAMLSANAVLILTAFGLYYLGSDTFRSWVSGVHISVGLFLPILSLLHIFAGRRSS